MRWKRGDLQVFAADLFVVLIPVALLFATLGLPGWRFAGVELRLYQCLLLVSLPFALAQGGLRILLDAWRAPGIPWIGLSLLLSVMATFFFKEMSTLEARELKNTTLPILLTYFVVLSFATSYRRIQWILIAAIVGISSSVLLVSSGFLSMSFGVRSISQLDLFESFGLTYVWLGVGSATVFGIAAWFALYAETGLVRRGLMAVVALGALGTLVASGTRAALLAVVAAPVLLLAASRLPWGLTRTGILVAMATLSVISLFPDLPLAFMDESEFVIPVGAEGAERLTKSEAYQGDISSRLVWWRLMLHDDSWDGRLFGIDYDRALHRTGFLGHAHNVLVWARVMGGFPAALALAIGLTRVLLAGFRRVRSAPPAARHLARIDAFLLVLLIPVLLTNSWPGGTLVIFAFSMALSTFLSRAERAETANDLLTRSRVDAQPLGAYANVPS